MKKLAFAIGCAVLAACHILPADAAERRLRVGAVLGYTGVAATFDKPFMDGFRLGMDEVNADRGKLAIDLMLNMDSRSDPSQAVVATMQAIEKKIDVLLLTSLTADAVAAGRFANDAGVLVIPAVSSPPSVPMSIGEYAFGVIMPDHVMGTVQAIYAREDLKAKTAFLLRSPDEAYTDFLPVYFGRKFEQLGGKLAGSATYSFNQTDFGGIIAQIRALPAQPDVIFTAAFEPDFPTFLKQLRVAGITSRVLGADGIDTPTTYALGQASEGVVLLSNRRPVPGSAYEEFVERFRKRYGEEVTVEGYHAAGYATAHLLADLVRRTGSTSAAVLRTALASLSGYESVTGSMTYAGAGQHPIVPVHLIEVRGGKPHYLRSITPAPADIVAP